jgi:hypothetical protein
MTGAHLLRTLIHATIAALAIISVTGCTIPHHIAKDYPQYLANNSGQSNLETTDKVARYALSPSTQQHRYEFRAMVTGYANLWIVEFGQMLDAALMSADAQRAFGGISKVSDAKATGPDLLVFDLQHYSFEDFGAHIVLTVSIVTADGVAFEKIYTQDGKSQGSKMFWGGAFAQKNAVQQSTKLALDEILGQLIVDLNATRW